MVKFNELKIFSDLHAVLLSDFDSQILHLIVNASTISYDLQYVPALFYFYFQSVNLNSVWRNLAKCKNCIIVTKS